MNSEDIITSDIVMLVFTSALNLHERALSVQQTWLKDFEFGYLVGGYYKDQKLKMISAGDSVGENYASATSKQFYGLKKLYEKFPTKKWYFITGCDAFVFSSNLCTLLSKFNYKKDCFVGGHCGEIVLKDKKIIYPSGGPGFALSNSLTKKIVAITDKIMSEFSNNTACDAILTYYIYHYFNVQLTYCEGFYSLMPYRYPENTFKNAQGEDINAYVIDKPIAFHNVSIREQYQLYSGKQIYSRSFFDKCFDKITYILSRRLKTKKISNIIAKFF